MPSRAYDKAFEQSSVMAPEASDQRHEKMLRAWQLALLRFAVTREAADQLHVSAIAGEIDRLGQTWIEQSGCHSAL